jgi:hypothetical protein
LSTAEVVLTVVTTVLGALVGVLTSHIYFKRGLSSGPQLVVGLVEKARIDPSTVGVKVEMKVGSLQVTNLVVLEVTVSNPGGGNLSIADADDPRQHPKRPRIELPEGLRALADPWNPEGAPARADVRVARQLRGEDGRQLLYVHVHGLASGENARVSVLCSYRTAGSTKPLAAGELRFFPGMHERVTASGEGLLKDAPVLRG